MLASCCKLTAIGTAMTTATLQAVFEENETNFEAHTQSLFVRYPNSASIILK